MKLYLVLYPTKKDLANILRRLQGAAYPIKGTADHGVSLAIYLNDPDGNGVELYWDRPQQEWPADAGGNLLMGTDQLDINALLEE